MARLTGEFADWHNVVSRTTWLTGGLDVEAVREAWRRACLRHDVMRRTFVSIDEAYTFGDALSELQHYVATTDEDALATMHQMLTPPFDLFGTGLSRIVVVSRSDRRHLLGIAVDHVISDRISWARLHRDFSNFYAQAIDGGSTTTDRRAHAAIDYDEFATRQRREFSGSWGEERKAFWSGYTDKFGSFPPPTSLGCPHADEPTVEVVKRRLPHSSRTTVRDFANLARATPFSVIASSVLVGLLDVSGDITAGLAVNHHGRVLPGTAETVGLFVQTVPLHLRRTKASPLEVVREIFVQSLDVFEFFVPLGVAGSLWGLDIASARAEPGVILSIEENPPREPSCPRLPGMAEEEVNLPIAGGKTWPDTIAIEWHLVETDPQIVARFDGNVFQRAEIEQLVDSAIRFALSTPL